MSRKKWAMVILLLAIIIAVYFFFFFKTYSEKNVVAGADHIITLDVKKITNTLIWNYITSPGEWKLGSLLSSQDEISWRDMVKIPDYIFVFHVKGQPVNAWYTVFEIDDAGDFQRGLQQYGFTEGSSNSEFQSEKYRLKFIRSNNKILLGNLSAGSNEWLKETARSIFERNQYISRDSLKKNIERANHITWRFSGNKNPEEVLTVLNFDKSSIHIQTTISFSDSIHFQPHQFQYAPQSLLSCSFVQPPATIYKWLSDSSKARISKLINFNIDSFCVPGNQYYQLELNDFRTRIDSAISYTYDEQFNAVEKVTVNEIREPAFKYTIKSDSAAAIFNYLKNQGALQTTEQGDWFTPVPFAKSYGRVQNGNELTIQTPGYAPHTKQDTINALLAANLNIADIPADILKLLPGYIVSATDNLATFHIKASAPDSRTITADAIIKKKKNNKPLFK